MRRLVVMWIVLGACSSGGPRRVGAQPSWRTGPEQPVAPAGPLTFTPTGEPASHYNEPPRAPPSTPLNDAVTAAVRAAAMAAGLPVPVPDARLFRACADLAQVAPETTILRYKLVEFALQHYGIAEPSPRLLVVWGDIGSPEVIVEQLSPLLTGLLADGATARLGVGAAQRKPDGSGAVVFALQGSGVSTLPIPRVAAAGATLSIDAVIDPRFHDPEMFVTHEDGDTERLAVKPGRPGGVTSQVACGTRRGRQQVEITASDEAGSTVLANFPVWCATAPPRSITSDPEQDDQLAASTGEAERRLLANVNRDRLAARRPALVWDDRLAEVARRHSDEMWRTHVVAHISKTTGSAGDRVTAAKIRTALVLENVARAYGVDEAHDGLMNSPGHRMNLMSAQATHIGIGVVFGDEVSGRRELFVTQVFTRVPPTIQPATATATVRRKLTAFRPKLAYKPVLAALAQRLSHALAAGHTREEAHAMIKREVDALGRTYGRVGSVIIATADVDTLDGTSLVGDASADDFGVGVAQGPHPEIGDNAIWVVVLLASRRGS
jgi:uncharacterized protein YkwD